MAEGERVSIYIDGTPFEVDPARNLLDLCLGLGFDLPYFCWHPALGSVGACRQCAVKQYQNENDERGRLVMACLTAPSDGGRISVADEEARRFRKGVVEGLMVNHPHDCPICDEGGECHLQDVTVMTGHAYRRARFPKRTHRNQYLGPLVNHEMNRCIQCYRCVRFYQDFAGADDLGVFGAHDDVYFGRAEDGVLESEFAGNLVEVCPTGVFTDKSLASHYARKWDMNSAPSVCSHCSLGCNSFVGERYGTVRRVWNRYNGEVNGYFLCDRGRYGYDHANSARRLRACLSPHGPDAPAERVEREEALARLGHALAASKRTIGIGSPRASLEANFTLRTLVGANNFYQGVAAAEASLLARVVDQLRHGPVPSASLREVERADAALVLGEDVTATAPMAALALRQTARTQPLEAAGRVGIPNWHDAARRELAQDAKGPLYLACASSTKLDPAARAAFHGVPEEIARFGFAVAHALDSAAPEVPDLDPVAAELAATVAGELAAAERPVVVSGTSLGSAAILDAAEAVTRALEQARSEKGATRVFLCPPEANSLGLAMLGGEPLEAALDAISAQPPEDVAVVIVENDPTRRIHGDLVRSALALAGTVVVIDSLAHEAAAHATVALPAAAFGEAAGTFVNNEGRAQRFQSAFVPDEPIQASWRWLRDLGTAAGRKEMASWQGLDDVLQALALDQPALAPVVDAAPDAEFRIAGTRVPRASHRYSGRTAMHAHIDLRVPKPPVDLDSPLAFSMEGAGVAPPPALLTRAWSPGWNSAQSWNRFQEEIAGPLHRGDPGVRLLEPDRSATKRYERPYPQAVPPVWSPRTDAWRVVVLHHTFGSEELSAESAPLSSLAPKPYLALAPHDANRLGVAEGDAVTALIGSVRFTLPARLTPGLSQGALGVPVGLPGVPAFPPDAWASVETS